jgi:hypothetical protein
MRGCQQAVGPSPRCEGAAGCHGRTSHRGASRRRQRSLVRTSCRAFPWQKQTQQQSGPPRPNERFTKEDVRRIKQRGPTLQDVTVHLRVEDPEADEGAGPTVREYDFVPPSILGDSYYKANAEPEPDWRSMPQMNKNLFLQGLRERNWTSEFYKPDAPKWHIRLWSSGGARLDELAWDGYKAVVTEEWTGRTFYVLLNMRGAETGLADHAGGGRGGPWKCAPPTACSRAHARSGAARTRARRVANSAVAARAQPAVATRLVTLENTPHVDTGGCSQPATLASVAYPVQLTSSPRRTDARRR